MMRKILNIVIGLFQFLKAIWQNRFLIVQLAKLDFKKRYLGSYLGLVWAFAQPFATIFVMWFVFSHGFKTGMADEGIPFVVWLIVGMIPWFFISDSILSSQDSINQYSFLIRNINFRASIIPLIKIFAALVIHVFFLIVIVVYCLFYKIQFDFLWFQSLYYLFCTIILLIGISWLLSALNVFVKDVAQLVSVIMQFLFWLTPIFWSARKMLSPKLHLFFKINPFYYITEGYRYAFLYKVPFWEPYKWGIIFWATTIIIFIIGAFVFKKLKPHFADVV